MAIQCRLCGKPGHEVTGVLQRVNEKGVEGVWECRPSCDAILSVEEATLAAIEGKYECQHLKIILGPPRRCADCGVSVPPCLHSQVVYEPDRRCSQCGIPMPPPYEQAKMPDFRFYSAKQLREELLYEYLAQAPDPGLFEFLDWLAKQEQSSD